MREETRPGALRDRRFLLALVIRPNLRLVAFSKNLSRSERARLTERREKLDADHGAGTITDERYIVELGKLEARVRSTVAVFIERSS